MVECHWCGTMFNGDGDDLTCSGCKDDLSDEPLPAGHGAPAGASQGVAEAQSAINDLLARQSLPDDIDRAADALVAVSMAPVQGLLNQRPVNALGPLGRAFLAACCEIMRT